ncbi:hypothetical protein VTN00DRAFT_5916 [Thermoascus crustaceus]|uniref:uncharacterized protein n=1 Tax=Thermoascus crustaceus TaxID=5088 RepID=UPI0037430372
MPSCLPYAILVSYPARLKRMFPVKNHGARYKYGTRPARSIDRTDIGVQKTSDPGGYTATQSQNTIHRMERTRDHMKSSRNSTDV